MEYFSVLLVATFLVSVFAADSVDNLACCPPEKVLINITNGHVCYDTAKNTTEPMKPICNAEFGYWYSSKVTIEEDTISIAIHPLLKRTYAAHEACHGNETNRNFTKTRLVAIVCKQNSTGLEDKAAEGAYHYSAFISVVFLTLTTIIYAAFKELRDLFGSSVINFCGSLAIGLGIYSSMWLVVSAKSSHCAGKGFMAYLFLMVAFFWTNSISIQVLRDTRRPATVDYGWKELRWYMLYSWGVPTVLTTIMAIVNYHPGDHERAGIGLNSCWFYESKQQWYYMYSVVSILLLINLGIFIYVATIVWRLTFATTPLKALKFKLSMTLRLIVLMGLPWIFEMFNESLGGRHILLVIFETLLALQGVLIFLVLVIRKRVIKLLYKRGFLRCCSDRVEKWLAVGSDPESDARHTQIGHTEVPLYNNHQTNGNILK